MDGFRLMRAHFGVVFYAQSNDDNAIVHMDVLSDILTYMVERVMDLINYDVLYI